MKYFCKALNGNLVKLIRRDFLNLFYASELYAKLTVKLKKLMCEANLCYLLQLPMIIDEDIIKKCKKQILATNLNELRLSSKLNKQLVFDICKFSTFPINKKNSCY